MQIYVINALQNCSSPCSAEILSSDIKREFSDFLSPDYKNILAIPKLIKYFASLPEALKKETDPSLIERGQKALEQSDTILQAARDIETLIGRVANAKSTYTSKDYDVHWDKAHKVNIKIAPAPIASLTKSATFESLQPKVTVAPDWLIRPGVGLTFLTSDESEFPTYGTKKDPAGVKIFENGTQNGRFTWGLTLGATFRGLDWRDTSGFAIWPLEFTINPSSDLKSMALGAGISYKVFKFSAGYLWTKHTVLDGQIVGDVLADPSDLKTRTTYEDSKLYFGVSIFGWPPFVK
jgi:hypothetical protein